jgi:hypothetical protein
LGKVRRIAAGIVLFLVAVSPAAQQGAPAKSAGGASVALLDVAAAAGKKSDGIELLALKRIFTTLGVPCEVLTRRVSLEPYRVVFTAGALVNAVSSTGLVNDVYDYVEGGGVLVSAGEVGSDAFSLFGVAKRVASRKRYPWVTESRPSTQRSSGAMGRSSPPAPPRSASSKTEARGFPCTRTEEAVPTSWV